MQLQMDKPVHCFLLKIRKDKNSILWLYFIQWQCPNAKQSLQPVGGMGANPSNKSIIGAAFEVVFVESERDERPSNDEETGALLLELEDKMSTVDELLSAEGDPIDRRSKRTSLPLFEAWPATKNANKVRHTTNMFDGIIQYSQ